jgi:hypothetical protein
MTDEKARDQFRDYVVTEVDADESGNSWGLTLSDNSGMSLDRANFDRDVPRDLAPRAGDRVRLYGHGYDIRGVDLNGRQLYYRTQLESEMQQWRTTIDSTLEQRERFRRQREELDAKVAALSPQLQARIERLRAEDPDFRWKWEALMLVIYVAADRIAESVCRENGWTLGDVGELEALRAIEAFRMLSVDEQEARIPQVHDCQSGASWRETCELAMALLSGRPV